MALSKRRKAQYGRWVVYSVSIVVLIAVALFVNWGKLSDAMFRWDIVVDQFPNILTKAAKNTLIFTVLGFAGGLILGLLFALMRLSQVRAYRWFAATYIEVFRGIPLVVTLLILGFALAYWQDADLANRIDLPEWYPRLRAHLSIVASLCLAAGVLV